MTLIQSLILGIVEGITEYLPISSTGHLILVSRLLSVPSTDFAKSFEIFIQLGAICAIIVLFVRKIFQEIRLWPKILAAFLPTAIAGLLLYKLIKQALLGNVLVTAAALFLGGLAFLFLERYFRNKKPTTEHLADISWKQAVAVGSAQILSLVPGVSRSASSILGGQAAGLSREVAVEFSFFLAIPTMVAATGYDLLKSGFAFSADEYRLLAVGFAAAFVTAIIAVRFFLSYIRTHTFVPFGIYRMIVAVLFVLFLFR